MNIPEIVAEHYRRNVLDEPSTQRGTRFEQKGEMRLAPEKGWLPFTAEQTCAADETRFVWKARFRMAPLVTGTVEDAYEDGRGRLDAKLWGLLRMARARGPEVDRGEAQRYLAELPWCPMALLHNPELQYRSLGDDAVRVWIDDEETYVDLRFDAEGDIVGARTETRSRGDVVQPWEGRFWDYRDFGDLRAPAKGEVHWETPDGPFVYWRGEIVTMRWATP